MPLFRRESRGLLLCRQSWLHPRQLYHPEPLLIPELLLRLRLYRPERLYLRESLSQRRLWFHIERFKFSLRFILDRANINAYGAARTIFW